MLGIVCCGCEAAQSSQSRLKFGALLHKGEGSASEEEAKQIISVHKCVDEAVAVICLKA